jgi:hypothetical protein
MHMANEDPPSLGGEADPNLWDFESAGQEGPLPNPVGHTFPLLTHDPSGSWSLLGTGAYISSDRLFITARHVVSPILRDGRQIAPLVILHPLSGSSAGMSGASFAETHIHAGDIEAILQ